MPAPSQAAEFNKSASDLSAGVTLRVFVGVHAVRELHPKHFHAMRPEPLRVPLRCPLAGIVGVVSQTHALNLLQRLPKFIA